MANEQGKPDPGEGTGTGDDGGDAGALNETMLAAVNAAVNSAITARLKKSNAAIDAKLSQLTEAIAKLGEPKAPADGGDPADKSKPDPVIVGLQRQIEALKADTETAKGEAAAERNKARTTALRSRLTDELVKGGMDAARARHAVGFLVDVERRVKYAEDGDELLFVDKNEDVDFATGLKGWLKSDDAKIYLPARGASGSGDRGAGSPPRRNDPAPDRSAIASALQRAMDGG